MVVETHLRSDAQRNLERILEAARAVFAERGLDASVADVAAQAGVGTATIFRRFPTKDDLCVAVIESELEALLAEAEAATSLADLMTAVLERYVADRCLCDAIGSGLFERPSIQALKQRVGASFDTLLRREQEAGTIRPEVMTEDIEYLVNALGQQGMRMEKTSPGSWRKYVDLVLGGLKP
jgi:AcrR family transcriptional regulator